MTINNLTAKLSTILNYVPRNIDIFIEALTHKSSKKWYNYERLEFLGDALIELIVTEYLYFKYTNFSEGILTSIRSAIVKTESLARESIRLGLNDLIIMSKGEEKSGGRTKYHVLANVFESITGAIYIDSNTENPNNGITNTKLFIEKNLLYKTEEIYKHRLDLNPKTKLQEITQEILKITPIYKLIESMGPDHNKTFISQVLVNNVVLGEGKGKTKQESEKNAAKVAIENFYEFIQKEKVKSN